jgi:hypothetical protein
MAARRLRRPLDPQVKGQLRLLELGLRGIVPAEKLWQKVLTEPERKQLGGDLEKCFVKLGGAVGMWQKLHGLDITSAVLDLARTLNGLNDVDYCWLRRKTAAQVRAEPAPPKPRYDQETGELWWGTKLIYTARLRRHPTNPECILKAFQQRDWCIRIKNPLRNPDLKTLHDAVAYLNTRVAVISFHSAAGGTRIAWRNV